MYLKLILAKKKKLYIGNAPDTFLGGGNQKSKEILENNLGQNILESTASENIIHNNYYITFKFKEYQLKFKRVTEQFYVLDNHPFNFV